MILIAATTVPKVTTSMANPDVNPVLYWQIASYALPNRNVSHAVKAMCSTLTVQGVWSVLMPFPTVWIVLIGINVSIAKVNLGLIKIISVVSALLWLIIAICVPLLIAVIPVGLNLNCMMASVRQPRVDHQVYWLLLWLQQEE